MSATPSNRRSTHVEMAVAYAAVGASKNADLLRFPPEGTTPYAEEVQLGSGQERFLAASAALMTWGAQRGTGLDVRDIERGANDAYIGPDIDASGQAQVGADREEHFGPDGTPYVVAGMTAALVSPAGAERRVLIVYTLDEPRRAGFAWGTSDTAGAVGEQLFTVEHRDDGTVWAVARGFLAAPRSGLLGIAGRNAVRDAIAAVRDQLAALAPGAAAAAPLDGTAHETAEVAESPDSIEVSTSAEAPEGVEVAEATIVEESASSGASAGVAEPTTPTTASGTTETADALHPAESTETAEIVLPDSPAAEEEATHASDAPTSSTHQRRPSRPTP